MIFKQTVPTMRGRCEVRIAEEPYTSLAHDLVGHLGRPTKACILFGKSASPQLKETVRRALVDAQFSVVAHELCDANFFKVLSQEHMTQDDALVGIGGEDTAALLSFYAEHWCSGITAAHVATSLASCISAAVYPKRLTPESGAYPTITVNPALHFVVAAFNALQPQKTEDALLARAYMVKASMLDSKNAVDELIRHAQALATGKTDAAIEEALNAITYFGRIYNSSSLALRRSITYGDEFASALKVVSPDTPYGVALAEGMRFSARLAVTELGCDVSFVTQQDALLEALGLHEVLGSFESSKMEEALLSGLYARNRRLVVALPFGVGHVRLLPISKEVLIEHVRAWCMSKREEVIS